MKKEREKCPSLEDPDSNSVTLARSCKMSEELQFWQIPFWKISKL